MQHISFALTKQPADAIVRQFTDFYRHFSLDSLPALEEIYTQDIEFVDPLQNLHGSLGLKKYLKKRARHLQHYNILYTDCLVQENCAYLSWQVQYAHRRLRRGQPIQVSGISHIKFTSKIYYQQDSYDLGSVLYDHLPLLGTLTGSLKKRLGS